MRFCNTKINLNNGKVLVCGMKNLRVIVFGQV